MSPDAIEPVEADTEQSGESIPDAGLHAKLYVADAGREARVWTGSANATSAAFGRNVEFLVELTGRKQDIGIDTLFSRRDGIIGLRDLLVPFVPAELPVIESADDCAAEAALEAARLEIAGAGWIARVTPGSDGFDLVVSPARMPSLPPR